MLPGLLTLLAAQLFDLGTFVTMIERHGPTAEANPIVATILAEHGLAVLFVAKLAVVALASAVVTVLARGQLAGRQAILGRRLATAVLVVGIVGGIVGGLSNGGSLG